MSVFIGYQCRVDYFLQRFKQFDQNHNEIDTDWCPKLADAFNTISKMKLVSSDWPCKQRSQKLVTNHSAFDLPDFNQPLKVHNIIDWSTKGQIAVSFVEFLVLWNQPSSSDKTNAAIYYKLTNLRALKYNPLGTHLAVGVDAAAEMILQFWEIRCVSINKTKERRFAKTTPFESIVSIAWESTCINVIFGTSSGKVYVCSNPGFHIIHNCCYHSAAINNIEYSINDAFVAITDISGQLIVLRNNSRFELCMRNKRAHFIAWHPWVETKLLIGFKSPASIQIMDLEVKTTRSYYKEANLGKCLCALSVNHLSAEVVVSLQSKAHGITNNEIAVLNSNGKFVDRFSNSTNCCGYILWDPSKTKIAAIGNDDVLKIWNFF